MFVVLADSRTGSHLLKSLLNSHPRLTCYDEILGVRKAEKDFYSLDELEGGLVSYANLIPGNPWAEGNDTERLIKLIRKMPVIHLTRDLTERAKSQLFYAKAKKKTTFSKANLEKDVRFDPRMDEADEDLLSQTKKMFIERQSNCLPQFEDVREGWLELSYEWLCEDQELRTLSRTKSTKICHYLQVPVTTLRSNLYKIRKFGKRAS